ncbi:MAG: UbiA family prenyltransferase, partial [Pseudoxanthomonas sp.]
MNTDAKPAARPPGRPAGAWHRLTGCIRLDEVSVLQGAPLLGACFTMPDFTAHSLLAIVALIAANACLVAHIFVLNDWAGIEGDARDPNRAARTFASRGVRRIDMVYLGTGLLVLALLLFSSVNATVVWIAIAIAALSALYSAPGFNGKATPIVSSVLHLTGGTLHFLLGSAAFAALSWHGVAVACYFGMVFAAGHLTQEARDHDSDRANGIRTNAVAFGRRQVMVWSLVLFTIAYVLLTSLAWCGAIPGLLALAIVLYPLQFVASLKTLRSHLDYPSVCRLQRRYRQIHAVIGLV